MELVPFADVKLHPDQSLWQPINGIAQDPRIAIALFVIEGNDLISCLIYIGFYEFARLEDAIPSLLFQILHSAQHLLRFDRVGAIDGNFTDFDLFALVDGNIQFRSVLERGIGCLNDRNFGIPIPFVVVIISQTLSSSHHDIFVDHPSGEQLDFPFQRFLLGPTHPLKRIPRQAWQFLHLNDQIHLIIPNLCQIDADVSEKILVPEIADGPCNFLPRNRQLLTDLQSAKEFHRLRIGVFRAEYGQPGQGVLFVIIRCGIDLGGKRYPRREHQQQRSPCYFPNTLAHSPCLFHFASTL